MSAWITKQLVAEMREAVQSNVLPPQKPRVLVVDDDPTYCEIMGDMLKKCGCSVEYAQRGEDAVEKVRNAQQFRLVLLDMFFPEGPSGPRILRDLRDIEPKIPIVIITGYSDPELEQAAKEVGCKMLNKPVDIRQIESVLQQALKM